MILALAKEHFRSLALVRAEAVVNMLINTHCAPVLTKYEAPD